MLTALDVLGYERPTKLRGERARLVGLVLPELQNPIFPAFAEVVGGALAQNGYTPAALHADRRRHHARRTTSTCCCSSRSRAWCSSAGTTRQADAAHDHYARLRRAEAAHRAGERARSPELSLRDRLDRRRGRGRAGLELHLRAARATAGSASLLGPADHIPSQRKLAAARRVCSSDSASPCPTSMVVHSHYSLEAGQAGDGAAARRRASPAIICARDPLALGAIRAVRRAGLRCRGDVSVVGFDDSALMNCTEPPLTTVRQPIEPMGRMVIELLRRPDRGHASAAREELALRAGAGRAGLHRAGASARNDRARSRKVRSCVSVKFLHTFCRQ